MKINKKKQNVFCVKKDKMAVIITCVCILVISLAVIALIFDMIDNPANVCFDCIVISAFIALSAYFAFMSPTKIELTDDAVIVHRVLGRKIFRYVDIKSVERFFGDCGFRLWGSGGFFGYVGLFSSKDLGRHFEYVGDFKEAFLIVLVSGRKYVLSCVDSSRVVNALSARIEGRRFNSNFIL